MIGRRYRLWQCAALVCIMVAATATRGAHAEDLIDRNWVEVRTVHFQVYSCVATQEVLRLAGRLEQFHQAYGVLAGTQAAASHPVVVMLFPDRDSMQPFLAADQPLTLQGFFAPGKYQNAIVMALGRSGRRSTEVIFHEYAHQLFRHNADTWPLWLVEGMADIYATFDVTGASSVCVGKPIERYLEFLRGHPMMPLPELFAVDRDSPQYNEREQQGTFYSESWLLTHYLMLGNSRYRAGLGQFTTLLRQRQPATQAFTNTFRLSLGALEKELQTYLRGGRFQPLYLTANGALLAQQVLSVRPLSRSEVCFRLGSELMQVRQFEAALDWFNKAARLDSSKPYGFEGLGCLAHERGQRELALDQFREAFAHGSSNYVAHFLYAMALRESRHLPSASAAGGERPENGEIRSHLLTALKLMPTFAPACLFLGESYLVENEDLDLAERYARRAAELDPYNPTTSSLLSFIQAARKRHPTGAGVKDAAAAGSRNAGRR